jgi:iduronate 2-sulfatase
MRCRLPFIFLLGLLSFLNNTANAASPRGLLPARPNILFLAVDDLRPELAAFGATHMQTPNLDRLAEQGLIFHRAYCSVATCGASRASLFTGVRPTPSRFVSFQAKAAEDAPWAKTMNTHFQAHGYRTVSLGKVFHHPEDNADGWSTPPWRADGPTFALPENREIQETVPRGPSYEAADVPDETYRDGQLALKAVAELEALAQGSPPFFLAVGFQKPHLPFVAPQRYWDLYPPESIALPANYRLPENVPPEALHNFGELRNYAGIPKSGPLPDALARELIRGYYACVSYIDTQAGKVLGALDRLGLADNTIVVLWGDHGWNLGDHMLWCKHSTFESSLRIPLIIRAPGYQGGTETHALTESIDLYPTLCELAGLPTPATVEGISLVPLLKFPQRPWKTAAYSRFRTGDSIRTEQFRFSAYHADNGEELGKMLYDHHVDPLENHNIVDEAAMAETEQALQELLAAAMASTARP